MGSALCCAPLEDELEEMHLRTRGQVKVPMHEMDIVRFALLPPVRAARHCPCDLALTPVLICFRAAASSLAARQEDLSPLQRQALDETFAAIDVSHTGYITAADLKVYCKRVESVNVDAVAAQILAAVDKDGDGQMSKAELLRANIGPLLENARLNAHLYDRSADASH